MVLTHEDAPLSDQMPYLVHRLSPVPVTTFVGRAAKREPPVPVKDCLWWWFKDPASSTGSRAVPCNAFACARACSGAFRPPCMCCQKHRSSRWPTPHAHTPRPPFHSRMHCASSILRLAVLCLQMLHASPRPAVPIVPLLTFCHGNARARHDTPCTAHARRSCLVGFFFVPLAHRQDVGFPYMLDTRHPEDTLFLFSESDFRFYECDCLEPPTWLPLALRGGTRRSLSPAEPEQEGPELVFVTRGGARRRQRSFAGPVSTYGGAVRGGRPRTRGEYYVGPEIRDLVEIATVAHRTGVGEFVWCSWSAAHAGTKRPKRTTAISYGCFFLMFTQASARFFLDIMTRENAPDFFDLWLLSILNKEDCSLAASYCVPPIGGFSEHPSANYDDAEGVRPSTWREAWAQQGTRASLSPPRQNRWLNRFCKKGVQWHAKLDIPGNMRELFWATLRPPLRWYTDDPTWQSHLRERQWILPDGRWEGPAKGRGKGPAFRGSKGKSKTKHPQPAWALLATLPDGFNTETDGTEAPITRLAEQLCTALAGETELSAYTARQKRARQWAISQYKFRYFVDDPSEAVRIFRRAALRIKIHLHA